jgi:AcrR family transcriptional regulator
MPPASWPAGPAPPSVPRGTRAGDRHDQGQARLAQTAIDLFEARGVDDVTVDDIVTAAGTSARTFHRYFTAKEETVLADSAAHGRLVADAPARQSARDPWSALRQSLQPLTDAADAEALRTTASC